MSTAFARDLSLEAERERLLAVPDYGRVVIFPSRKGPVIDFYPDLKGRRRYLVAFCGETFADEEAAETVRRAINESAKNMELADVVDQFRSARANRDTVWEVCERFLAEAPNLGSVRTGQAYTPRTIAHYGAVLRRARSYFERMPITIFCRAAELARFKAWFSASKPEGRGLRTDTEMANAMIALRAVVRYYRLQRPDFPEPHWPSMPTKLTIGRREQKRRRDRRDRRGGLHLTLPQVVHAISAIPEPRQPIFWVLFFTQARLSEARAVLGCDYEDGRVYIERSAAGKSAGAAILDRTKTGADGGYLMPPFVQEIIERHCTHARFAPELPLFRNPDIRARAGQMWSEDALYATWRAATVRLGLSWVPPYRALKHTQISALRGAGISVDDIVEQCRWTSPEMLERYDDARDERRDAVVVKLAELAEGARSDDEFATRLLRSEKRREKP